MTQFNWHILLLLSFCPVRKIQSGGEYIIVPFDCLGMVTTDASYQTSGIRAVPEDSKPLGRSLRHSAFVEDSLPEQSLTISNQNIMKAVLNKLTRKLRNKAFVNGARSFQSLTRTKRRSPGYDSPTSHVAFKEISAEKIADISRCEKLLPTVATVTKF